MSDTSLHQKLVSIQSELKAPKGQLNKFGGYKYRSCEDILEALKPLLKQYALQLTITDDVVEVGGRIYVRATAFLSDGQSAIETSAFAREAAEKKGMDDAQITGAASSYARKYALNGLFCIDDTKDADATNDHKEEKAIQPKKKPTTTTVMEALTACTDIEAVNKVYDAAMKHDWTGDEKAEIDACKTNVTSKLITQDAK